MSFFITIETVIIGGYFKLLSDVALHYQIIIACMIIIFAVVFRALDNRTRTLIRAGMISIEKMESTILESVDGKDQLKLMSSLIDEKNKEKKRFGYSFYFDLCFFFVILVGVIILAPLILKLIECIL